MKSKQSRKPTMNEVKNVISNLLIEVSYLSKHVARMDSAIAGYIKFKGDTDKYNKWLEKKLKEKQDAERNEKVKKINKKWWS